MTATVTYEFKMPAFVAGLWWEVYDFLGQIVGAGRFDPVPDEDGHCVALAPGIDVKWNPYGFRLKVVGASASKDRADHWTWSGVIAEGVESIEES